MRPSWRIPALSSRFLRRPVFLLPARSLSGAPRTGHFAEPATIYALSTAPGRSAIAIIRLSGSACLDIYRRLCPDRSGPKPRLATLRTLYDPSPGGKEVLDSNALALYFPAPRTVTGEDVLELHVHGGPAIVKAVLSAISRCNPRNGTGQSSIRYAEPGEFTRRAFLNDRLDLTQVEALGDTLSATTEQQRRLSVRGTVGALAKQYEGWRKDLLYARGELEALIDFSEDQHFDESPTELCASVAEQVRGLKRMLEVHSQNAIRGELLRNGISISLLGAPNAGKSSLLNRIVGREAAIVSQEAGTTRDVVEIGLDIGGYFCRLGDTAGLRKALSQPTTKSTVDPAPNVSPQHTIGEVEKEGMRRAKSRAAESDVVLVVLSFEQVGQEARLHLDPEVITTASELCSEKNNIIVLLNKADLVSLPQQEAAIRETLSAISTLAADRVHLVSCKANPATNKLIGKTISSNTATSDEGNIQTFLSALITHFHALTAASTPDNTVDPSIWQESLGASERHRVLLQRCIEALQSFLDGVDPERAHGGVDEGCDEEADIVVAAEHLRSAAECLAKITGKGESGDVEEVLGVVFEKFCVGK